ncbi:MAG: hypothetical protein DCC71_15170 [Proteobacteria bacterium]|nr:MAG: hypothetical protein DCC71_15170 [Pseudomonadota bacterium]
MDGARARRASRTAALATALTALLGCTATAARVESRSGGYRDRAQGWTIAAPAGSWKRVQAEGADLALAAPDGTSMSVTSRCEGAFASPAILARHLRLGLGATRVVERADARVAGAPAAVQVFDVERAARPLRVKTVTRVAGRCVQDFVLVAPGDFAAAARVFDAWWASFAPGEAAR